MQILVSYRRAVGAYTVKTLNLNHNHSVGEAEFRLYPAQRRPNARLREMAESMLRRGADPNLVTNYLNEHDVPIRLRDICNIRSRLNSHGKYNKNLRFAALSHCRH